MDASRSTPSSQNNISYAPTIPRLGTDQDVNENIAYELLVRQHPNRARMCGFGTKDYRPVDPAPILQLIRRKNNVISIDYNESTSLVVHASLWSSDGTEERSVVLNPGSVSYRRSDNLFMGESQMSPPPSSFVSVLVGGLVSPCHVLTDVDGTRGMFFTFSDLSIRTGGQYRLKFFLYDIKRDASRALASAMSDVINVYPPKTFPGMTESSQLAKCLARQGIRLHIRTDMRRNSDGIHLLSQTNSQGASNVASPKLPQRGIPVEQQVAGGREETPAVFVDRAVEDGVVDGVVDGIGEDGIVE